MSELEAIRTKENNPNRNVSGQVSGLVLIKIILPSRSTLGRYPDLLLVKPQLGTASKFICGSGLTEPGRTFGRFKFHTMMFPMFPTKKFLL